VVSGAVDDRQLRRFLDEARRSASG
jgi:hypothetical protein